MPPSQHRDKPPLKERRLDKAERQIDRNAESVERCNIRSLVPEVALFDFCTISAAGNEHRTQLVVMTVVVERDEVEHFAAAVERLGLRISVLPIQKQRVLHEIFNALLRADAR